MKFLVCAAIALMTGCLSANVFGQIPAPREDNSGRTFDPWRNEQWNRFAERPKLEGRVVKKGPFAPSAQDQADYAAFLKHSNTGLIKLLPYQRANEKIIRGGGSYYSFHYLSHEYGRGSDLSLTGPVILTPGYVADKEFEKSLVVLAVGFAGADYGMLSNLGDASLDEITLKDPRVRYLAEYEPPVSDPDARCEARRFRDGEIIDGLVYKSRLPVQAGATYLLRSIVYNESDVLVAFRVLRQDDDGSVVIAWKLLKDFHSRELRNINVKGPCN